MRGSEQMPARELARGQDEVQVGRSLFGGGTILGGDAAGGVGNNGGALNESLKPPSLEGDLVDGFGDDSANIVERCV